MIFGQTVYTRKIEFKKNYIFVVLNILQAQPFSNKIYTFFILHVLTSDVVDGAAKSNVSYDHMGQRGQTSQESVTKASVTQRHSY